MNQDSITKLMILCGVAVPSVAIFGSRLIGTGVSDSFAATPNSASTQFEFQAVDLKRELAGWDGSSPVESPFWTEHQPKSPIDIGMNNEPRDVHPRLNGSQTLPEVSVTSILPNSKNPLAIINGKPCRVGETIAGGWTVLSINGDDHSVTLLHSSGAKVRAGLKKNH